MRTFDRDGLCRGAKAEEAPRPGRNASSINGGDLLYQKNPWITSTTSPVYMSTSKTSL